jgi:hypothetical protein
MRAKRDYAMLALLFGCGFRRSELVSLELDEVQMRQGHWAVVDLIGKGGHIRTVPIQAGPGHPNTPDLRLGPVQTLAGAKPFTKCAMDQHTIRERVTSLQQEVARIQEQNRQYLAKKHHNRHEEVLSGDREARLVQILEELAALANKKRS